MQYWKIELGDGQGLTTSHTVHRSGQCSRLESSMPFKHDLALQAIPLFKQPFKTQPHIENEDVT